MFYDSKMFKNVTLRFAFCTVLPGYATRTPVLPLPRVASYHELDGPLPRQSGSSWKAAPVCFRMGGANAAFHDGIGHSRGRPQWRRAASPGALAGAVLRS
jgi:hypothetical protein